MSGFGAIFSFLRTCALKLLFTCSIDGASNVPDGDMGVVMQNGANLRFTDLAPGATAQLVSILSGTESVECIEVGKASYCFARPQHLGYVWFGMACNISIEMTLFSAVHGKLILIMEDGTETLLENPGDVVIQRGTMHAWRNPGPKWTRWITVILDANPVVVSGRQLGCEVRSD